MTASPDSWEEFFLIAIQTKDDSTWHQFAGMTDNITDISFGEKDIEGVPLANGGRVVRRIPMTDESITVKMYPVDCGDTSATSIEGFAQLFHPQAAQDETQPITVVNSNKRNLHQVVVLWSSGLPDSISTANEAVEGYAALRWTILNAYITSFKYSLDDNKELSAEAIIKWAPFSKAGVGNKTEESTDGTANLTAVSNFTS